MQKHNASIAIQVLPMVGEDELLHVVDKVIEHIKASGLKCVVGPFETTVEGDFDKLWDLAKECQMICVQEGAQNLLTYLKVAYNPTGVLTIDEKVAKHNS